MKMFREHSSKNVYLTVIMKTYYYSYMFIIFKLVKLGKHHLKAKNDNYLAQTIVRFVNRKLVFI